MTEINKSIIAITKELDASPEDIETLFKAFVSSLKESRDELTTQAASIVLIKSILHKFKGEAYSLNLIEWAHQFEALEARATEYPDINHHQLAIDLLFFINEILNEIIHHWPNWN